MLLRLLAFGVRLSHASVMLRTSAPLPLWPDMSRELRLELAGDDAYDDDDGMWLRCWRGEAGAEDEGDVGACNAARLPCWLADGVARPSLLSRLLLPLRCRRRGTRIATLGVAVGDDDDDVAAAVLGGGGGAGLRRGLWIVSRSDVGAPSVRAAAAEVAEVVVVVSTCGDDGAVTALRPLMPRDSISASSSVRLLYTCSVFAGREPRRCCWCCCWLW